MRSSCYGKVYVDGGQRRLIDLFAVQVNLYQLDRCHVRRPSHDVHRRFHRAAIARSANGDRSIHGAQSAQRYDFSHKDIALSSAELLLKSSWSYWKGRKGSASNICVGVTIQSDGRTMRRESLQLCNAPTKITRVNEPSSRIKFRHKCAERSLQYSLEGSLSRRKAQ